MPESEFNKSIDAEEEIKLDSSLIYADWSQGSAFSGGPAKFEVATVFVGNGAKIEISGKSEGGKKLGKIKSTILANKFVGSLDIPEDVEPGDEIYFEVKISANSIDGESSRIPVYPLPIITNMAWSAQEARRGDVLKLTADVEKVEPGTEVLVAILEYDNDGAHDKIVEIPAEIRDKKLEVMWEYEYHEDVDELPTSEEVERYGGAYNPPEYFFVIDIKGFRAGTGQESGLLTFKDWVEFVFTDRAGEPVADEEFIVVLPDGEEKEVKTDSDGVIRLEGIPPGNVLLKPVEEEEEEEEEEKEDEEGEPDDAKTFQASDDEADKAKEAVEEEIEDGDEDELEEETQSGESTQS